MGRAFSAFGREERRMQGFWWGNLKERHYLGDPGVDGRVILRKWDVGVWTGLSWFRIGTVGGHL